MSRRPPPPTNRPNRPLLFTTQANSSQSSSSNSSIRLSPTPSSRSAATTQLDYDSMDEWMPLQLSYLLNDTTAPNGPGTFVNLDPLPPPPSPSTTNSISLAEWISGFPTESRPITPTQDNDEEPEDTGAGIGGGRAAGAA